MKFIHESPDGGRLYGPIDPSSRPAPPPRPPKPKPLINWSARHAAARDRVVPGELSDFAEVELNLSAESMDLLQVGVEDEPGSGWLFPERDGEGRIIGLVRRTPDGEKLALKHAKRGLTFVHPLPDTDPILCVEGASDTAAALSAGFNAVGRPSASGGGDLLAQLLRGRDVIVMGENDEAGRDGAERIAQRLRPVCKSVKVMFPPPQYKDLRRWFTEGGAS